MTLICAETVCARFGMTAIPFCLQTVVNFFNLRTVTALPNICIAALVSIGLTTIGDRCVRFLDFCVSKNSWWSWSYVGSTGITIGWLDPCTSNTLHRLTMALVATFFTSVESSFSRRFPMELTTRPSMPSSSRRCVKASTLRIEIVLEKDEPCAYPHYSNETDTSDDALTTVEQFETSPYTS